jgi:anaerobic selenocysteine-containing dehydrogenase
MQEQRNSDKRLLHPQVRASADDDWRRVSWQEVISHSAGKLSDIRDKHGPDSVAFVVGYTKEVRPYLQRLAYCFGSPHYLTESSCCFVSGVSAAAVTLGREYAYYLGSGLVRSPESRCRLVWSNNPAESRPGYDHHYLLEDAASVPLIVVDPRCTSLTGVAAVHLRLRPGTDGALALGLAHVIFEEGLEDKAFLAEHAHGLDAYKQYVKEFTPERTSDITDIPKQKIIEAARLYARSHPAQVVISPSSSTHHSNGFQSHRAILLLSAICGNLDVTGGNKPLTNRLLEKNISLYEEKMPDLTPQMGEAEFPLFTQFGRQGQAMLLADYIETGKVKAVFSVGMNVMMWPNSKRLERALKSLEFFSTCDFFPNPTVEAASVFFPAATHLERQAIIVGGDGRVQYRPVAVPPLGEAKGDTELMFDMAAALGLKDMFWDGDIRASFDERLQSTGLTFDDLPGDGESLTVEVPAAAPEREYEEKGFGTPTGKVEFASTTLEKAGYDALPVYKEPYWSPRSAPEIARDFPLILTSGGRSKNFTHSQGRELETLLKREPEPRLQINPEDAGARDIEDGAQVEISSPLGKVVMTALVTTDVPAGVVHAPHGWKKANINEVVPDKGLDPISGFPPFKSGLCNVARVRPD